MGLHAILMKDCLFLFLFYVTDTVIKPTREKERRNQGEECKKNEEFVEEIRNVMREVSRKEEA